MLLMLPLFMAVPMCIRVSVAVAIRGVPVTLCWRWWGLRRRCAAHGWQHWRAHKVIKTRELLVQLARLLLQ